MFKNHIRNKILVFRLRVFLFVLSVFFISLALYSDEDDFVKLGGFEKLEAENIKMRVFKDSKAMPLNSVREHKLIMTRGGEKKVAPAVDPMDAWFFGQCVGRWGNSEATVYLGKMTLMPPDIKPDYKNLVLKKKYEKWLENSKNEESEFTEDEKIKWLKHFAGSDLKKSDENIRAKFGVEAEKYALTNQRNRYKELYIVYSKKNPESKYILLYDANPEYRKKAARSIERSVKSVSFYRSSLFNREKDSKKITFGGRHKNDERSDEYIEQRKRIIQNIKNLSDWWYMETDNYIVVANLDGKGIIRQIEEKLEGARKVYKRYFPIIKPISAVSVARVFKSRDGYLAYVGPSYEWTGGLWSASKKELIISPFTHGRRSERSENLLSTIFHEAFHQYIYYSTGGVHTSIWFNEGNATFFEGIKFQGTEKFVTVRKRMKKFRKLLNNDRVDLENLLKISNREWQTGNSEVISKRYASVWGIMFFLQKGSKLIKNKNNYNGIIDKYYKTVTETKNPELATRKAWEGVDRDKFMRDMKDFWESDTLIRKAIRLQLGKDEKKSLFNR